MGFAVAWVLTVPVLVLLAVSGISAADGFIVVCLWAMFVSALGLIVDDYRAFVCRYK